MEDFTQRIAKLQEVHTDAVAAARKAKRIEDIVNSTKDKIIQPGFYTVTETDGGGMYEIDQFSFELRTAKNLKEIALILMETRNYMSPWNDLAITEYKPTVGVVIR